MHQLSWFLLIQIIGVIWFYKNNIKILHKIVLFAQYFLIYEKYHEINNALRDRTTTFSQKLAKISKFPLHNLFFTYSRVICYVLIHIQSLLGILHTYLDEKMTKNSSKM